MTKHWHYIDGVLTSHTVNGVEQNLIRITDWPLWAKALRQFSQPTDKGIGDVVARIIGAENSGAFKAWYQATFGKPCGCAGRQAYLNRIYPIPSEHD